MFIGLSRLAGVGCLVVLLGCGDGTTAVPDAADLKGAESPQDKGPEAPPADVPADRAADASDAGDARDGAAVEGADGAGGDAADGDRADSPDAGLDASDATDVTPEGPPVPEKTGLPLPEGVPPPRRLLDARATLTAGHTTGSCSHQMPGSADGHRWCAFSIRAADNLTTELWVIDASRGATGAVPVCDGTDPGCLRLHTNLWTEFPLIGPGHPFAHNFEGDTLIFYADASSVKNEIHRGPVFAWRPGWTAPRQLTSNLGLLCEADRNGARVICMDDLAGDPVRWDSVELRAGRLADETAGPLPSLGRIQPASAGGFPSWQASFTPAGDLLAVSGAYSEPNSEILRVVATDSIGAVAPVPVLLDTTSWAISNDGKKIYYFGELAGEERPLFVADFPAGTNVVKLADAVRDYLVLGDGPGDQGVGFLIQLNSITHDYAFAMIRDSAMPAKTQTVFKYNGFVEGVQISKDLTYTAWLSSGFRGTAVHNESLQTCELNTANHAAFDLQLLASGGLVFWTEEASDGLFGRDGFVTNPASCTQKDRFGRGVYWYTPVANQGLVYGDEYGTFERTVTLKYVGAIQEGNNWRLGQAVRIDERADPEFILVGETSPLLLYVKQHGEEAVKGTYVFGPVPF